MDIREIRDTESKWPMTLPTKEQFENCISKVSKHSRIINNYYAYIDMHFN